MTYICPPEPVGLAIGGGEKSLVAAKSSLNPLHPPTTKIGDAQVQTLFQLTL
jgi:hypothetical protein